jgi:hypothetical protein
MRKVPSRHRPWNNISRRRKFLWGLAKCAAASVGLIARRGNLASLGTNPHPPGPVVAVKSLRLLAVTASIANGRRGSFVG